MDSPSSFRERLESGACWLSARYPFIWRTRAGLWLGAGVFGSLLAAIAARWVVRLNDTSALGPEALSLLATSTMLPYVVCTLLVVDVVRRTSGIFSAGQRVRLFGCLAASTIALLCPGFVFDRMLQSRIGMMEPADTSFFPEFRSTVDQADWFLHVAVTAVLAGGIIAILASQITLHTRVRRHLQTLAGWRRRPKMDWWVDRWLASRWPTLWSSRIHVAIWRFLAFSVLLALFVAPSFHSNSSLESMLGLALVMSFFALLHSQEQARYQITDANHETSVYVMHAVVTTVVILAAMAIWENNSPNGTGRSVGWWLGVFVCAALQAVRNSSAFVAFTAIIVLPFIYLPFFFLVIAADASPTSALFHLSLGVPSFVAAGLLAWSNAGQVRASVRRWLLSLTVLSAPLPALACALATGLESGKGATGGLLVSGLLVTIAMRLMLRFTENTRRSLAIAAM